MGDDYYNFHVYVGERDAPVTRARVLELLGYSADCEFVVPRADRDKLPACSEEIAEEDQLAAVGPPGRWIVVYALAEQDMRADFASTLSQAGPTVCISMDDSAVLHLRLFRDGILVDRFGMRKSVLSEWSNEAERLRYVGQPTLWSDLLLDGPDVTALAKAWYSNLGAWKKIGKVARLMGWNPDLCDLGYTIDYDGIPVYWRSHLQPTMRLPEEKGPPGPLADSYVSTEGFSEFRYKLS